MQMIAIAFSTLKRHEVKHLTFQNLVIFNICHFILQGPV